MSTNMRDFPARYGLEFGSDRTVDESDDDDFCNSTEFGGSNDHPYTLIDVTQYYEKNESAIESCIYKALGISKNQNITCEENKVQITINEQKN
uniref:Uncharacterized protein n=1 Tax=Parastrongyloides trichosuri TaxID=131310 RepID=A0A0N4ZXN4_PARTI